ncbi:dephospho-CoA kinase [Lachnobacterium bovis]|uniref:Dephospho-CoA kinase n=1 Tax=Lachnobacterium bovis TaxID=140626 RepID=A0A1H9RCG2_9FIRM|nr:dephospho-CoA kinase [Lachnobacterium bovis]SER70402.1 dephospho-CoA kinase [Lachnobacterium bovis]
MKFIGITGGVGAGKSAILNYLNNKPKYRVMLADEIAHELMKSGTEVFKTICNTFKNINDSEIGNLVDESGEFNRKNLAKLIFSSEENRKKINDIVHPAVKEYVKEQFALEKERGQIEVLVLEAALLIEENYDAICDELWYIYTSEDNRRKRLKESRGYSDEKIDNIFSSQLPEEEFIQKCKVVIDNNNSLEKTFLQIEKVLRGELNDECFRR